MINFTKQLVIPNIRFNKKNVAKEKIIENTCCMLVFDLQSYHILLQDLKIALSDPWTTIWHQIMDLTIQFHAKSQQLQSSSCKIDGQINFSADLHSVPVKMGIAATKKQTLFSVWYEMRVFSANINHVKSHAMTLS